MNLFYTASSDASIYLQQPYQNTGIDEILEISKQYYGDTKDVARTLIKFDLTDISRSVASGEIPSGSFTASLELKLAEANEIPATITLEARAISQSWENGTGTRFDQISTNGVTWIYRNGDDTTSIWNDDINGITASFTAAGLPTSAVQPPGDGSLDHVPARFAGAAVVQRPGRGVDGISHQRNHSRVKGTVSLGSNVAKARGTRTVPGRACGIGAF